MNNYESVSPAMREMLATHDAFRKLGFTPDDIFVHYNSDGTVLVAVHGKDDREFAVTCGHVDLSREGFVREWTRVVEAVRSASFPQADLDRMWIESLVYRERVTFVASLVAKGVYVPNVEGFRK